MAIEADSAGWTGGSSDEATLVCGEFHDRAALDAALSRLEGSVFQRADLSVQVKGEAADQEPVREDDARNLRTLGTSLGAAATGIAAAGVVIATGGAALPAVAAAAAAGGASAAAGTAVGHAATPDAAARPQREAESGVGTVLRVHAADAARRDRAEAELKAAGATRVWRQEAA